MRQTTELAGFFDLAPQQQSFRDALIAGLARPRKAIPCRFLYDERGSALFERICELPEYYPTRTETQILRRHAGDIAALAGPQARLIEFGSGSSRKVRLLLEAMERPAAYVAVDISRDYLCAAAEDLAQEFPALAVLAVCADYSRPFRLPPLGDLPAGRRLGFFPGSTIGNLEPEEALDFLALSANRLGPGGAMLVGVDLKKDRAILEAAYDDAQGVTAEFTLNLLRRANRELGANFALDRFAHDAHYNEHAGRIEIYLRSLVPQTVTIAGRRFHLVEGERIHAEHSYKYTVEEFGDLAAAAGFAPAACWTDNDALFSVHYLAVP